MCIISYIPFPIHCFVTSKTFNLFYRYNFTFIILLLLHYMAIVSFYLGFLLPALWFFSPYFVSVLWSCTEFDMCNVWYPLRYILEFLIHKHFVEIIINVAFLFIFNHIPSHDLPSPYFDPVIHNISVLFCASNCLTASCCHFLNGASLNNFSAYSWNRNTCKLFTISDIRPLKGHGHDFG